MNWRGFFLLLIILSLAIPALARIDVDPFLSSAWKDMAVVMQEKNLVEFGDPGIANPIENIQLRLSEDLERYDRKAAVRVEPRGFFEYMTMLRLRRQQSRLENLDYRKRVMDALNERYLAIIEFVRTAEMRRQLAALVEFHKRETAAMRAASRSSGDAKGILRARSDWDAAQMKLSLVEGEYKSALTKMKELDPKFKDDKGGLSDLPSPTELVALIDRLQSTSAAVKSGSTIEVEAAKEKALQVRDSIEYDTQKSGRLLDYAQLEIAQDDNETRYGVEIAINLPGFAGRDYSTREKRRQLVGYEIEARQLERSQHANTTMARQAVVRTSEVYRLINSSDHAAEERLKRLARRHDPLLALSLEKESINRSIQKAEANVEVLKAYVAYLYTSGVLGERPKTNFLTRDLREFRP